MNKSILAIVVCFIAALAIVNAGTVSLSWAHDYYINNEPSALVFEVSNVDLTRGIYLVPRKTDQHGLDTLYDLDTSGLSEAQLVPFGASTERGPSLNADTSCFHEETHQFIGTLQSITSSQSFVVRVNAEETETIVSTNTYYFSAPTPFNRAYGFLTGQGQTLGNFKIKCPVMIRNTQQPTSEVFTAIYNDENNYYANTTLSQYVQTNVTVPFPEKGLVSPHVNFLTLKFIGTNTADSLSSTQVEFTFTTDHTGVYRIESVNAPIFGPISSTDGKHITQWCSHGKETKFARIFWDRWGYTPYIHITTVPSDKLGIKCNLYFTDAVTEQFVTSERSSMTINFGQVSVARTLDFNLKPAYVWASAGLGSTSGSVTFNAPQLLFTTTPIKPNSTIVYKFGDAFDVSTLSISSQEQGYRSFACSYFIGTIFVEKRAIVLKDILLTSSRNEASCTFTFSGANYFRFDKDTRVTSVSVEIDGTSLVSYTGKGTEAPIYYGAGFSINNLISATNYNADVYSMVHTFSVSDTYQSSSVTPRNPIIQFSFTNNAGFTNDNDWGNLLTCEASTPTDSEPKSFTLTYDAGRKLWSAPIKSIVGIEKYSINFRCKNDIKRIVQYGIDITPQSQMNIYVIDLIDNMRFISYKEETTITFPRLYPVTEAPPESQLPPLAIQHVQVSSAVYLEPGKVQDSMPKAKEWFTNTYGEVIANLNYSNRTDDKNYKNYTITKTVSSSIAASSGAGYFVENHGSDEFYHYYYDVIGNDWVPFSIYAFPYGLEQSTFRTSITGLYANVTQVYTTEKTGLATETESPIPASGLLTNATNAFYVENFKRVVNKESLLVPHSTGIYDPIQLGNPFFANRFTECGYSKGLQIIYPNSATFNMSTPYNWTLYTASTPNLRYNLCQVGDSCSINADCQQSDIANVVCRDSKCVMQPKHVAPYIWYEAVTNIYLEKQYYNSSFMVSAVFAILIAVVGFIF